MTGDAALDHNAPCPTCQRAIGEHTFREYGDCLKTADFDYVMPFEDIAGGPMKFPGVEGEMVGEVTVMSGAIDSPLGRVPILRFVFTGAGPLPMSRRSLAPINLVMDANGLRAVADLVATAVGRSIKFAGKAG